MEIVDVLESIREDDSVRVVVIRGAGTSFCSGDDLKNMGSFKPLKEGFKIPHHKVMHMIREIPKPFIALLHGYCLGAGFELALACDFRLGAEDLVIGDHRTSRAIGIFSGASWFLPRLIGFARATEIIFKGRHLDAKEALEIGLLNRIYSVKDFNVESREFIEKIAKMPTKCLGYNKAMLNYSLGNDLFKSLQNEFKLFNENSMTNDYKEGNKSFFERRDPVFEGR
ncbi:hypothetical protein LCGC14_0941430 [marine sediment metagenome]|uniref:Enoyl-CoA hydratase n=1 Tax=marine sediment metagenome TaxID=412755 RepID=A0A0F9P632_9ZZZZ|nr:MAG: 3-hydroxypropionyl-coenzyme A dehydratase [Candidatus Lokiarchaeum sp. GC14_75]